MTTEYQQSTPWRTVAQAAARAQTGERLIYREVQAGRLKCARVGGRRELRFRDEWIDAWLEASTTPLESSR
jgi:excisionase family DNA binding protein